MNLTEAALDELSLQDSIEKQRQKIKTDAYSMSIGELMSLYQNKEIDIHPEFLRYFRWTRSQKSRLIESMLLGIPVPQIFVAQRSDGVWEVIDGLQRLATIFEFAGILTDEDGKKIKPLVLERTKYLPELENMKWDDPHDEKHSFTQIQRLYIKRTILAVSIIQLESDENTKYELFQRLNTGGSQLSAQEVRNCILVMVNKNMFYWMRDLSKVESFRECTALTDRALEEQYDLELILRFIVFRQLKKEQLSGIKDLGEFLTDKMIELAESENFNYEEEEQAFNKTFTILQATTREDSFRKFDKQRNKFIGGFSVSAYEIITTGIGYNYKMFPNDSINLEQKIKDLWANDSFMKSAGIGINPSSRIPKTIPLGRELFKP